VQKFKNKRPPGAGHIENNETQPGFSCQSISVSVKTNEQKSSPGAAFPCRIFFLFRQRKMLYFYKYHKNFTC
jgi:hypothetical protein